MKKAWRRVQHSAVLDHKLAVFQFVVSGLIETLTLFIERAEQIRSVRLRALLRILHNTLKRKTGINMILLVFYS